MAVETSNSSWAQLQVAERVFAYMPYMNFQVKIYQGSMTPSQTAPSKYFFSPLCLLDHQSPESIFNQVTCQTEVKFKVYFYNADLEDRIIKYFRKELGKAVKPSQLQVIPFERVILTNDKATVGYQLDNKWVPYELEDEMWFTLTCSNEKRGLQLAQEMRQSPSHFSFKLSFSLSSQKSNRRETIITMDNIVSGSLFTKLNQKYPMVESVLLTADDTKRLLSESACSVIAETFDDNEVPTESSLLYGMLEKLIISARETITHDSGSMWDSVFWEQDNYRPDKISKTVNDLFGKLDTQQQRKLAEALSTSNKQSLSVGVTAGYGGVSLGVNTSTSKENSQSNSKESDELNKLLTENSSHVEWNGEKFIPRPMALSRINLSTFRNRQDFKDFKTTVSYNMATLTAAVKTVAITEATKNH